MAFTVVLGLLAGYVLFAAVKLGLHQRIPLAFGPISLEEIPDRAAARYGDTVLFSSDRPCAWEVPALRHRYPDPSAWSARRIRSTAGYLATLLLHRLELERGDRIAVCKENHLDVHVFVLAIVRAGGIACPINSKFEAEKLQLYLLNIGARVLVTDSATLLRLLREGATLGGIGTVVLAEKKDASRHEAIEKRLRSDLHAVELVWLEEALADVQAESAPVARAKDEVLYLVHSSGTTGFPKAVTLKNGPQSHAVRGWLCYVHVSRSADRGYFAVPNNHQAVILSFNALLLFGGRIHWIGAYDRDGFDAERVVRELAEGRFTGFFGFPVTYTQLKEVPLENFDLRRMRFWGSTADASHEAVQRPFVRVGGVFRRLGLPFDGSIFLDAQGSSEVGTPSVLRYVMPFTRRFGRRIGRPGSTPFGPKIRVTKPNGRAARRGEVGRLEVKGKTVCDGYWNQPGMTDRARRGAWFFTGDVVRRGMDGHLIQLDREVDVIQTHAGPVYSLPIEEKIHRHGAVFDACVYGERQPDGAQRPAAAIALRAGYDLSTDALLLELNGLLAEDERLYRLDILPWHDFPMGVTGKTLKRVFRERTEATPVAESNRPVTVPGVGSLRRTEASNS